MNGTAERPRMSVYRSNKQIYVQLIDDQNGTDTWLLHHQRKKDSDDKGNKIEQAEKVGKLIAEKAKSAGIENVVFRQKWLFISWQSENAWLKLPEKVDLNFNELWQTQM